MAQFTNFATLTYTGGATNSNTVTGEIQEVLTLTKEAATAAYAANGRIPYVLSLVNSGTTAITNLTLTDDLGAYTLNGVTRYPLAYVAGTMRYYVNGVLQTTPTVEAGPPLVISGLTVPAGGNAMVFYEAQVTAYASPDVEGEIVNTVTLTGGGLPAPLTATATVTAAIRPALTISKALCPATVQENGRITYTFVVENTGNAPAAAEDALVLTDVFDPILRDLTVTLNGTALTEGTQYAYNQATGAFATTVGVLTVPAATYTRAENGTYVVHTAHIVEHNGQRRLYRSLELLHVKAVQLGYFQLSHNRKQN